MMLEIKISPREQRLRDRNRFATSKKTEREYASRLKQVARTVGDIITGFKPTGTLEQFFTLRETLLNYGSLIRPWAQAVAARMLGDASRRDAAAWAEQGNRMGRALSKEIQQAPTGEILKKLMHEQVELITSLPRSAAERVHKLTLAGIAGGARADQLAEEILRTGKVTRSRAETIARTETSRTATNLTAARATWIGSEFFIWRTAMDGDVRPLHKKLEGKAFRWDDPPVVDLSGVRALPGAIWNCRCYPEPIIPDLL